MASVGIRELQRDTSGIVGSVAETRRPVFVTNRSEVVAVMLPVDPEALEDFVLAGAPEYVRSMEEADLALIEGRTRSAGDVFAEMDDAGDPAVGEGLDAAMSRLTAREREVLVFLADNRSSDEIARALSVSRTTVRRYVRSLVAKLRVESEGVPADR